LRQDLKDKREWIKILESELAKFRNQAYICENCRKKMFGTGRIIKP
jgi:hypothetical protein